MTASNRLEARYRRLLGIYPEGFRRDREAEMLAVLMAGAREDQRWPRPAEVVDLVGHAAPALLHQGPRPDSLARRHPRGVIAARILVSVWLIALTVFFLQFTPWALSLVAIVALHTYLTARTVVFMRDERGDGPPTGT